MSEMSDSTNHNAASPTINDNDLHNIETATSEMRDSGTTPSFLSRTYILGPVKKSHGDLALLACCLATGMADVASFSNWGALVGMQTGKLNTVLSKYKIGLTPPIHQETQSS
jgi:hypothetical protein